MNQKGYPRPSIMALSRQAVPNLPGTSKDGVSKGGYIIHGGDAKPDVILMGTGEPLLKSVLYFSNDFRIHRNGKMN